MASNSENPSKKKCTEDVHDNLDKSFTPRSYQIEILETAKQGNTIACLGTGTGKTFIAVMLIRECAVDVRLPFDSGGKRIFFLVPTVPLVHQQQRTISEHTDLKVKPFSGDMNVDSWNQDKWTREFQENEVLVMTAEIFRIIVDHAFISLNKIRLVIFDECHRAQGDHPYCQAMKCFTDLKQSEMPKIFGLSASLINGKCKPTQLERQLTDLEKTLRCSITTVSDVSDLQRFGADPEEYLVCYKPYFIDTPLLGHIQELKRDLRHQQSSLGRNSELYDDADLEFFDKPLRCLNSVEMILNTLGPWCTIKAAEVFVLEINAVLKKSLMRDEVKLVLCQLVSFLEHCVAECRKFDFHFTQGNRENWPHKLQRLLEIFAAIRQSKKFLKESVPAAVDTTFEEDPEKFYRMLQALEGETAANEVQVCSIVFVEQRIMAYVLCEWMLEIKKCFPQLNFLNPSYIVGHGASGMKRTSMSEKRQKSVLRDFRQKKCNVLISTCVLEEGMDVQQCNAVIRFDLPFDFRGYVQSKGRARSKNSIYVLMSEMGEKNGRFCLDMCNFKTIEKMLLDKCHNRTAPSEEEIQEFMADSYMPPFMPYGKTGARITLISAISVINRYCSKLPCDMATKLTAKWIVKDTDPDNPAKEFECTLKMPINSRLHTPIVGLRMPRKRLAKMAAALKACQLLFEIGELNDHLVPISSLLETTIEDEIGSFDEEESDENGALPGTKRRRQVYPKHVPVFLRDTRPQPSRESYLHVIRMNLAEPLPDVLNPRKRPITDPAASPRGLGLLMSKRLPKINSFPLFTLMGKVVVSVSLLAEPILLTAQQLQSARHFHRFLFSDALHIGGRRTFSPDASPMPYLVLPTHTDNASTVIDWSFISEVLDHPYNRLKRETYERIIRTDYSEDMFEDAVVLKTYWKQIEGNEFPTFNHVMRMSDKLPGDHFERNVSFDEYYSERYGIEIENKGRRLIETFSNAAKVNVKPLKVSTREIFEESNLSKTKLRHMSYHEYLVPELCLIHPFPSSFFLKVQFLPSALFRIRSLLVAEELRQSVATRLVGRVELPEGFRWPHFDLETSDRELRRRLCELGQLRPSPVVPEFVPQDVEKASDNRIVSFARELDLDAHPGPDPSLLLRALTTRGAGDEFDLERLEMIGDSFLKFAVSVKTYFKYASFDEGKLTKIRSSIIQNLNLYRLGKRAKLPERLVCTGFSCKHTFLPPCYSVDEEGDTRDEVDSPETIAKQSFTLQKVSDKCVADSAEALIGAYLLSCGQKGALMFMSWLGLNPLPHKKDSEAGRRDFSDWPSDPPPSVRVERTARVEEAIGRLTAGLDRFESRIGYRFGDRALLLQALTHPSYSDNEITDCFQRLEFLGDAVLDFLITRQLYEDPNDHSPGKLTDLRTALVNNIYFASLAVKYDYHKHLKMAAAQLFALINHFLVVFENSEAFRFFKEHGYALEEIECFELEEVEVPKALGDVFESVAGAIYLDSGMSLDTVWNVYYPMIAPAMRHLSEHVPKNPVRELYELVNRKDIFSAPVQKGDKTYILATLPSGKEVPGVGPNKKVAKRSAAKRALAELKKEFLDSL